jgi:hypothetical protein
VDDLEGSASQDEAYIIEATAFGEAPEPALLVQRGSLGTGKWWVRNLWSVDDHGLLAWPIGASAAGS